MPHTNSTNQSCVYIHSWNLTCLLSVFVHRKKAVSWINQIENRSGYLSFVSMEFGHNLCMLQLYGVWVVFVTVHIRFLMFASNDTECSLKCMNMLWYYSYGSSTQASKSTVCCRQLFVASTVLTTKVALEVFLNDMLYLLTESISTTSNLTSTARWLQSWLFIAVDFLSPASRS